MSAFRYALACRNVKVESMYVIFDIDGTCSDPSHRSRFVDREEPDWDAFFAAAGKDAPIVSTMAIMDAMYNYGMTPVIITARPESIREITMEFFKKHIKNFNDENFVLLMRPNDQIDMSEIDIKESVISHGFIKATQVLCAFENNPDTATMYRSHGITTYELPKGY